MTMKDYATPELIKLGDALELTLGTRPGADFDQSGAELDPYPPCCCGGCGGGGCIEQN
jgi:hypothetical protein